MDGQEIKRALRDIYRRFFERYGPQHWWPADNPFEVIIGAILTQSTAWNNVEKAIANLKNANGLSAGALRELPEEQIAELIYPSGYYNVKSRKLKAFVRWLGQKHDDNLDELFSQSMPDLREQLLGVCGIGEETADSIILYAAGKPVFVIDTYTRRLVDRLGYSPQGNSYSDYQELFVKNLPTNASLFNEYHALIVRHGKEVCRKSPLCDTCCLNEKGETSGQNNTAYSCSFVSGQEK
jgi:endonuclease-3 related protein